MGKFIVLHASIMKSELYQINNGSLKALELQEQINPKY